MMHFDEIIKAMGGAVAFIELNDDSVWQVGIIRKKEPEEVKIVKIPEGFYAYNMYVNPRGNIGFIEEYDSVNARIAIIQSTHARYYGLIVSEELLPLGKIEVLCYKKVGIEEFPSENKVRK